MLAVDIPKEHALNVRVDQPAEARIDPLLLGDVHAHAEHGRLAGIRYGERNFYGLKQARAAGKIRPRFLRDDLVPGAHHGQIVGPVRLGLRSVGHQIEVVFPEDLIDGKAGELAQRGISEDVAAGGILCEDAVRHEIRDEAQPLFALAQLLLRLLDDVGVAAQEQHGVQLPARQLV